MRERDTLTCKSEVGLGKWREFLVYAVIFVIAAGSVFDILTQREHWPFSPYSMFSSVRRDYSLTRLKLLGVTKTDATSEIQLTEPQYIQPLGDIHIQQNLSKKKKQDSTSYEEYLEEALSHILSRYEVLRIAGEHDGPELRGIRLYRYEWKLDPMIHAPEKPDARELIFEVREPRKK
jgi:hypothetical protein